MKKEALVISLLILIILFSGCVNQKVENEMIKEVNFKTRDGFTIYGTYYKPNVTNAKSLILLHMLRTDRSYWRSFAYKLMNKGYAVIAIDLRGHGQSLNKDGTSTSWQSFTDQDFNYMILDIAAAKQFLSKQAGIDKNKIGVIGASIGANAALNYAANDTDIDVLVLLSPGLDYHGVKTENAMKKYDRPVLIVVSSEDESSMSSSQVLYDAAQGEKDLKVYNNAGHGTNMFTDTDLDQVILDWLEKNFV
jgi:alpha-beta hydrolase superfamily lysophospholipase